MRTMTLVVAILVAASCGTEQQQANRDEPGEVTPGTIEINTGEQELGFGSDASEFDHDSWTKVPRVREVSLRLPSVQGRHLPSVRTGDWSGEWIRMILTRVDATPEVPVHTLRFTLYQVQQCGEDFRSGPVSPDICNVLDCETVRISWRRYDAGSGEGLVGQMMLTDGTLEHFGWRDAGFLLDVVGFDRPSMWVSVVGRVRDDVPTEAQGRLYLKMTAAYYDDPETGHQSYALGGPIAGPEFDVGDGQPLVLTDEWCDVAPNISATDVGPDGF